MEELTDKERYERLLKTYNKAFWLLAEVDNLCYDSEPDIDCWYEHLNKIHLFLFPPAPQATEEDK